MNVAVTGYYNTGSSAVLDLLQEYQHVSMVPAIDVSTNMLYSILQAGCLIFVHY